MSGHFAAAVDLSQPGTYVHWSIFQVSLANLMLIVVMVVIFGLALVIRFPSHRQGTQDTSAALAGQEAADGGSAGAGGAFATASVDGGARGDGGAPGDGSAADGSGESEDASMWTARLRRRWLAVLPPAKLLPDRQPAYVASWVYVFGVATLAALGLAILSGAAIALGGVDWWHYNAVGHFFNSLHLWSVELFMAFMVIHLWGKFWMAAWRGRRRMTWITGVVAFMASVVECFTGYLSQQNFDSQWISTNGKDAINATGLGGFFNLLDFGQMLLWHIVLIPLVLVAIVGAHVLLVRARGVVHPLPERRVRGREARRLAAGSDVASWRGPTRRYDIVKEGTIAALVATVLVVALAGILSSPDVPPVTIASWARVAPADFLATTASELAGTSETATYGPPYTPYSSSSAMVQGVGISWQRLAGARKPIATAGDFVLNPLQKAAGSDPALAAALRSYRAASHAQQQRWDNAYLAAVTKVSFHGGVPSVPAADDGPVPALAASELTFARSGALDADLLAEQPFYGTDFTKPLLFMEDGSYFSSLAQAQHLTGSQWGVMNETGSYPGQPWLWLYTLWYQVPGLRTSASIDLIAIYLTGLATILLLLVPLLPGLRDIPRYVPLHRLIWRNWYRSQEGAGTGVAPSGIAEPQVGGTPEVLAESLKQ